MTETGRGRVTAGAILIVLGLTFLTSRLNAGFGKELTIDEELSTGEKSA